MADSTARRLIALLGRLTPGSRVAIAELAEQVGTTEARLAEDLLTLAVCGVAPFDPNALMPLIVEDGYVEVWGALPAPVGTVRLSAPEASALAAALQTAGFTATDDLTMRLHAAAASASFDPEKLEHTIRTASASHDAAVYEGIATALAQRRVLRIEHVRTGSDETVARDIEPVALFAERGAWYVTAWCRRAGDWRTFRVDRIHCVSLADETYERDRAGVASTAFSGQGLPLALLRFSPEETFSEREWPGARVRAQEVDGSLLVDVPFGGTEWIARHVVARLGLVEVVEPPGVRSAVAHLATDMLSRL